MNVRRCLTLAVVAGAGFMLTTPATHAQISVNIGAPPVCPYGYYDYSPYPCAPYGYYGPEWFSGGAFVGAGPWFHGRHDFYGHVDNHYDPHHGYHGPMPNRGDHADEAHHVDHMDNFHGNEMRDGRGHMGGGGEHGGEHH